jgi:hypothetical protein
MKDRGGIRGGTEKENLEAAQTEAAWRDEGGDAGGAAVSEVWRLEAPPSGVPVVRYVPW